MKILESARIMLFALALTICVQGESQRLECFRKNNFVDHYGDGLDGGVVPWIVYNPWRSSLQVTEFKYSLADNKVIYPGFNISRMVVCITIRYFVMRISWQNSPSKLQ
ncbi:hypothetical protein [Microbulbifer sp. TRSA005]|uniref:hypothetical protein n=1 Tax=Microbulbifer sp. TRSA005 TaxID=3243383 RepID=UPI004039F6D8